jgi:hypothetical protein
MSAFKPQQRHLLIQGRTFHFVSYEGQPANLPKNQAACPPMWYLMAGGRRYAVVPCDPTQSEPDLNRSLTRWVVANALAPIEAEAPPKPTKQRSTIKRPTDWWGPA